MGINFSDKLFFSSQVTVAADFVWPLYGFS